VLGWSVGSLLAWAQATDNSACATCHDQGPGVLKSAHASLACATCHVKHDSFPHPADVPKPGCGQCHQGQAADLKRGVHGLSATRDRIAGLDCSVCHGSVHEVLLPKSAEFRSKVPETCGTCHSDAFAEFRASVHGQAIAKGITQAPVCTDCHSEHLILPPSNPASSVFAGNIRDTCGNCHGNLRLSQGFGLPLDRVLSFDASFHGLATRAGNQTVANCASCHGVHNILPSSDPRSTINAKNLTKTCGKCHPRAGTRFAITPVHVVEGGIEASPARWIRRIYQVIIPLIIGLMLVHNGGDWLRKLRRVRPCGGSHPEVTHSPCRSNLRILPFERVQHALLAVTFLVLVWTGFALKYSDRWWARPLLGGNLRGVLHRIAAIVFMAVSLVHLISLAVNPRLRRHWKELLPHVEDGRQLLTNLAYNLGWGSTAPGRSPHSYVEKAEYWAVVWGAALMITTGLMLGANNLMLRLLPKTWLDVATSVHFYEALLATLAILVWHFYVVIFDPEVYPMDTAWLNGISARVWEPAKDSRGAGLEVVEGASIETEATKH
jgi:cytochrome b subunit of formate dehydrogenase